MLPNAIIAGTNRAGTTSLFRYLSEHPDVMTSRIKEVGYFARYKDRASEVDISEYQDFFPPPSGASICLEASPNYLTGGKKVASLLKAYVPDAKLMFILRDPMSRLLSSFVSRAERREPILLNLDVNEYVNRLVGSIASPANRASEDSRFGEDMRAVCYSGLLQEYLEEFEPDQLYISFFDDFSQDPKRFTQQICRFLELDEAFYNDYEFTVENKTRFYRSGRLQQLAFRSNMLLEPMLNRAPVIRRGIRHLYNLLNEKPADFPPLSAASQEKLQSVFTVQNQKLKELIGQYYPELGTPDWVSRAQANNTW